MSNSPQHLIEMAEHFENIVNSYSSDIPLPEEGDIFDIYFGEHAERYVYLGSDQCAPLYSLDEKFVPYLLSERERVPISWGELMETVDEALDAGEESWVETVLRRNSVLDGLEEKIDILKKRLLTVRDPQARVNIKNQIEFLES